jgi:hypothetical protein
MSLLGTVVLGMVVLGMVVLGTVGVSSRPHEQFLSFFLLAEIVLSESSRPMKDKNT